MKKVRTGILTDEFITTIVRKDLTPGYKCVQSAHALADFAAKFDNEFKAWQHGSNYLCCLEASEIRIRTILEKLEELNIKHVAFYEPDIDNQMTAIAIEAIPRTQHKQLFKNLKLALS